MTPFFFGTGKRRLFGVYRPARAGSAHNRAVVLCHPWGQEYLRAHRSMKQLGVMLSHAGLHVLHFDYFGTGDSGGDMHDANMAGWVQDVLTAVEELRDTTGAVRVRIVGLRLGASLTAMAAALEPRGVDGVVLWDPVMSGREYLDELLRTEAWSRNGIVGPPERPAYSGGGHVILGYPLTSLLQEELQRIELVPLIPKLPARLFLAGSRPDALMERFKIAWNEQRGESIASEIVPCPPAWLEDRNAGAGAIPLPLMQRIVQWMQ